ncbi:MAG TPA: RiPP maturation radical SAM C-methyltransferase, partial [Acidobacteriota bacterium]|nr:RiPP maturation radical SAM C-methyltransferase [Acidobacteriota bacterium]
SIRLDKFMETQFVKTKKATTLLVNMPFGPLFRPSLPLSLLKSSLASMKISTKVQYLTIPFAERIGMKTYARISNGQPGITDLFGEFLFSRALYGSSSNHYLQDVLIKSIGKISEDFAQQIIHLEDLAHAFIEEYCEQIVYQDPQILIFSSFLQQQIAGLALAKGIKARAPYTSIIFFGTNCNGVMGAELIRQFPFLDVVISGEPDHAVPQIVKRILEEESLSDLQGVYTKENVESMFSNGIFTNAIPVTNMDSLPYPDFDDFFEQHNESNLNQSTKKQLMFETARGCWWGERSHCTFCGLNSESMFYRSKSPKRALQELRHLSKKYPDTMMSAVDNILDMKYFKNFLPELAEQGLKLEMFYEVKANLKKDQIRQLREAGITRIQPGIESFSSKILTLMGKGVTALQNIQLLKWCKEYGIRPFWNILSGFPGEDPEEYFRMAELLPLLSHLPVPQSIGQIRIERFSPNFKYPDQLGFTNVKPYPAYFHIYPFSKEAVENLAWYFTYDYKVPRDVGEYTARLVTQVLNWKQIHKSSELFFVDKDDSLFVCDMRPIAQDRVTVIKGLQKILYLECDKVTTVSDLKKIAEEHSRCNVDVDELEALLEPLLIRGQMIRENNSYLSLAIRVGLYSPAGIVSDKFNESIQALSNAMYPEYTDAPMM